MNDALLLKIYQLVAAEPNEIQVRQTEAKDLKESAKAKGVEYQDGPLIRFNKSTTKDPVIMTNDTKIDNGENDDHYKPATAQEEETFSREEVRHTLCKTFHEKDKFSKFVWIQKRNSDGWMLGIFA